MTCLHCPNEARPSRRKCRACEMRAWRKAHPERAAFDNLRTHARQRGIVFALTLAQFCAFCQETGYVEGKGQSADSLTVDRVRHTEGYHAGNLQALTHAHNSRKGWFERHGLEMGEADEEELP